MPIDLVAFVGALSRSDDELPCPHCGHIHDLDRDPDYRAAVTSYHGDDHVFTCGDCGEDFAVREFVTRKFTAAKTQEALDDD